MSKPLWSGCAFCRGNRRHEVLHKESVKPDPDYEAFIIFMMIRCLGCHTISFRRDAEDYELGWYTDDDEYIPATTTERFPKFIENHAHDDGIHHVPTIVRQVYEQTLGAIENDARILAGLGLRGTVEAICNNLKVTGKDLEARIGKLAAQGYISKKDAERLHAIRFLGNDAAHEIKSPLSAQMDVALKIVDHALQTIYILEPQAKGELETAVSEFDEFEELLKRELRSRVSGDVESLAKLMGSKLRRVKANLHFFEKELLTRISSGQAAYLLADGIVQTGNPPKDIQTFRVP